MTGKASTRESVPQNCNEGDICIITLQHIVAVKEFYNFYNIYFIIAIERPRNIMVKLKRIIRERVHKDKYFQQIIERNVIVLIRK